MPTVRELLYTIGFKVDDRKLDNVNRKVDQTGKAWKRTGKLINYNKRKLDELASTARSKLPFIKRELNQIGGGLSGMLAGGALTAGLGVAGKMMVDRIGEFEMLKAQLVTILGSEEAADSKFTELQKFAATTPFQLAELTNSFAKLSATGINPTMDDLNDFGNMAAGMGKTFDQMGEAITDASTGEFERLKEFGIISRTQGNQVEFTFKGVKTKVKKESKEIVKYLKDISKANFAGGMERQSATVRGAISNLMDGIDAFFAQIGDAGLAKELNGFFRDLSEITGESESLARVIGRVLGFALRQLRDGLKFAKKNSAELSIALGVLAAALTIKAMHVLITSVIQMGVAFATGSAPIWLTAAALIAVGLIVEDLVKYFTNGAEASVIGTWFEKTFGVKGPEAMQKMKDGLFLIAGALALVLLPFSPWIALILLIAVLAGVIIDAWGEIPGAFKNMIDQVTTFFYHLFGWLLLSIYSVFDDIATAIGEGAAKMWMPILDTWETTKALIQGSIDSMVTYIFDAVASIVEKLATVPQILAQVPGLGLALAAGGSVANFIGGGASDPSVDAGKRLNQINNNSRSNASNINAPITVQVNGGAGAPGMLDELESKLSGFVNGLFSRAADDLDGAAQ